MLLLRGVAFAASIRLASVSAAEPPGLERSAAGTVTPLRRPALPERPGVGHSGPGSDSSSLHLPSYLFSDIAGNGENIQRN